MVTIVFRSRLRDAEDPEYHALAPEMVELARSMPGFLAFKAFTAEDGERLALAHFESLEAAEAWRDHPRHLEAQRLGRERFYAGYTLEVCDSIRAYAFAGGRSVPFTPSGGDDGPA